MTAVDDARRPPLVELARAIWHRRWHVALVTLGLAAVAVVALLAFLPDVYQSSATLLIEQQQVAETVVKPLLASEVEMRLNALSQDVLNRPRLQGLIDRYHLYPQVRDREERERLADRMRREVRIELKGVERKGRGDVMTTGFEVRYRGTDARAVAAVANELARAYVDVNEQSRGAQLTDTAAFLHVQLEDTKRRLDAMEARLGQFRKRYLGELPEQMQANLTTLEQLNAQLRWNSVNQTRAQERREARLAVLDAFPRMPGAAPESDAVRLRRLRRELADLRAQYSDRYPDVRRVQAEVAMLEQRVKAGVSDDPPTAVAGDRDPARREAVADIDGEIKGLKEEEHRLRDTIAMYQRRVENTPSREQEYRELSRDYDTTKEHYASLLKRYEEARVAESVEQGKKGERFRIVEAAAPSEQPAAPRRLPLLLVGFVLSVGLSAVATMVSEQIDTSFHSVGDIRAFTSVPVVAAIPPIPTEADRLKRRRRRALIAAVIVIALLGMFAGAYAVAHDNVALVSLLLRGR